MSCGDDGTNANVGSQGMVDGFLQRIACDRGATPELQEPSPRRDDPGHGLQSQEPEGEEGTVWGR